MRKGFDEKEIRSALLEKKHDPEHVDHAIEHASLHHQHEKIAMFSGVAIVFIAAVIAALVGSSWLFSGDNSMSNVSGIALKTPDPETICSKYTSLAKKTFCEQTLKRSSSTIKQEIIFEETVKKATLSGDKSLCEAIEDTARKEFCLKTAEEEEIDKTLENAILSGEQSACSEIQNVAKKAFCLQVLGN